MYSVWLDVVSSYQKPLPTISTF